MKLKAVALLFLTLAISAQDTKFDVAKNYDTKNVRTDVDIRKFNEWAVRILCDFLVSAIFFYP